MARRRTTQDNTLLRVVMNTSVKVQRGDCFEIYAVGKTYNVPEALGLQWINDDVAHDYSNPPACEVCLKETTSKRDLAWHMENVHKPEPIVIERPPVKLENIDPNDPEVQALAGFSESQLRWIAAQVGVTAADFYHEGEQPTFEEWIAAIVRSKAKWPRPPAEKTEVVSVAVVENVEPVEEVIQSTGDANSAPEPITIDDDTEVEA